MKKITLLFVLFILVNLSVSAQKISSSNVPAAVKAAFKAKYKTVTRVSWEMENNTDYEAVFQQAGKEESATFAADGNWIESETAIKRADLPSAVLTKISTDYAGYSLIELNRVQHAVHGLYFEAMLNKGNKQVELLLNEAGEVLEKEKIKVKEDKIKVKY